MVLVDFPPQYTNTAADWSISWYARDGGGQDCPSCGAFCTLNGVDQHCDILKAPPVNENGTFVSSKALSPAVEDGTYVLALWGQEPNCGSACVNGTVTQVRAFSTPRRGGCVRMKRGVLWVVDEWSTCGVGRKPNCGGACVNRTVTEVRACSHRGGGEAFAWMCVGACFELSTEGCLRCGQERGSVGRSRRWTSALKLE
jgi:hypothetical protein